jgi:hypothetical protein
VAPRAVPFDAAIVFRRVQQRDTFSLRKCPYCLSGAVRRMRRDQLEGGLERILLRCGECGTWRGEVATHRAVRAFERDLKRDRKRMARLVPMFELPGMPRGAGAPREVRGERF